MKQYPSIKHSGNVPHGEQGYVFVKYDGSNLRFEWSKKKGWYKFGTRKTLFDESNSLYGPAITLFRQKYADGLDYIIRTKKLFQGAQNVMVFCEWFGNETFAGQHKPHDEKTLVLFDVNIHKKGLISPRQFLDEFGHLEVAELLDHRTLNEEFIQEVRSGEFDCSSKFKVTTRTPEGVVVKGGSGHQLWMCKIKTQQYHDALKENLGENWSKYWE